jgi:hypothetical protein
MKANIDQFLRLLKEIEGNSWWTSRVTAYADKPAAFTFSVRNGEATITDVPSEPLESLLLRVRRLTMKNSSENLTSILEKAKRVADHPNLQNLYDAWYQHWRLSFIKEPYLITLDGKSQVMTAFKAYNIFVNGRLFHSDPRYQVILYGTTTSANVGSLHLFLKNQFHWTVANLCLAALGLRLLITSTNPIVLSGQTRGVTDFVWCRNQLPQLNEQYRIFSDWIEQNGGCEDGRWS